MEEDMEKDMEEDIISMLEKIGEQILTIKKPPPLPGGKVVKANLSMTRKGFEALETVEKWKGCRTHAEAFHIIYSWALKLVPMFRDLFLTRAARTEGKIRRTFGLNEYALAGFRKLSKEYDLSVDSIIDETAKFMADTVSLHKAIRMNKSEVLKAIDDVWGKIGDLRLGLSKTFSEHDHDINDPESPAYHFATLEAGLDGLYFLVKNKLFEDQS